MENPISRKSIGKMLPSIDESGFNSENSVSLDSPDQRFLQGNDDSGDQLKPNEVQKLIDLRNLDLSQFDMPDSVLETIKQAQQIIGKLDLRKNHSASVLHSASNGHIRDQGASVGDSNLFDAKQRRI